MFIPQRILFEKGSLDYEMGKNIYNYFKDKKGVEIIRLTSNRIRNSIPGEDKKSFYMEGKKTLVVGIKKISKFQSCKPSAHYQLPLVSGCIGQCQYCYLNTNLSNKPYVKVYVNIDEILNRAEKYIKERNEQITIFEGAATSDPLPTEPYTHALKETIEFFGRSKTGRFRFVSKYNDIQSLLHLKHNGHTEIRFSINTDKIISNYEGKTASRDLRIEASKELMKQGYNVGFIIAPVFIYEGWKEDYRELLLKVKNSISKDMDNTISFEVISHRYTARAKNVILEIFPNTTLPMNDDKRIFKYGQFGYGKYLYSKEEISEIKEFFTKEINENFNNYEIKYII